MWTRSAVKQLVLLACDINLQVCEVQGMGCNAHMAQTFVPAAPWPPEQPANGWYRPAEKQPIPLLGFRLGYLLGHNSLYVTSHQRHITSG